MGCGGGGRVGWWRSAALGGMLACGAAARATTAQVRETPIPTRYIANRFFATPVTPQGDTLLLLIDTGGGGVWMVKPVLERLGFDPKFIGMANDSVFSGGPFPVFASGASLPLPLGSPSGVIGYGNDSMRQSLGGADGILGHTWLAERVWVFDYPARRVAYGTTSVRPGPHTVPMTLRAPPTRNDPRIQVVIDGDTVNVLLDSGGTSTFSADAVATMGGGPTTRASSFAAARLWDAWHERHPAWRVVTNAETSTGASAIEVPIVRIAGYNVGPVWFVKRSNAAYDDMMSSLTDRPIQAAIGGAAFKHFRITMDYPNQLAKFERIPRRRPCDVGARSGCERE
jgi:hypothetical protein